MAEDGHVDLSLDMVDRVMGVLNLGGAIAIAVAGWAIKAVSRKESSIDARLTDHNQRITVIECTMVKRSDLDGVLTSLQEDLKSSFDRAHARIDALYTTNPEHQRHIERHHHEE